MARRSAIAVSPSGAHRTHGIRRCRRLARVAAVWGIVEGTYGKQGYCYGLASEEALSLLESEAQKRSAGNTPAEVLRRDSIVSRRALSRPSLRHVLVHASIHILLVVRLTNRPCLSLGLRPWCAAATCGPNTRCRAGGTTFPTVQRRRSSSPTAKSLREHPTPCFPSTQPPMKCHALSRAKG